jgi:NAD(P)-dependent dehydrogenase (short-subunit alcohol dehydrogenase family)
MGRGEATTHRHAFRFHAGTRGTPVNAVAPGVVETDMSNSIKTDAGREFALGLQALKRLAQPDDIGPAVAFSRPTALVGSPATPCR